MELPHWSAAACLALTCHKLLCLVPTLYAALQLVLLVIIITLQSDPTAAETKLSSAPLFETNSEM
jgi:hypothetical protein